MSYETINGWTVIPTPAKPLPKQIDITIFDGAGESVSPFTRSAQVYQWPGCDQWTANVSLPPMKSRARYGVWRAFLASLRGKANAFLLGDAKGAAPRGSASGAPVTNGVNNATSFYLATRGWTPNAPAVLLPGDYLQIGHRLHMVAGVAAVNADANGQATIEIWPSLREAPADGAAIVTHNCVGLWRLADNNRQWTANPEDVDRLSFKIVEAK